MKTVGGLFERFKHIEAPERNVKKAVIDAVKDIVGITIESDAIKISQKKTLYLTIPSALKTSLFEQKLTVISRINSLLGKDQIKELK